MMSQALPAAPNVPSVACVVLNWNGWRDTIPCVESLLAMDYPAFRVVIVDNGSTDDSVARIRAAFPSIDILVATSNRGFSAGCNLGIRSALERHADFVWLLNNDTTAPPGTLSKLAAAASGLRVGIVGTVLHFMHDPEKIQAWGGGSVQLASGYNRHFYAPSSLGPDSFLTFASVLLRSTMLEAIGLLDEGFFMYFEDLDLCFRARAAGWQLAVAADTAVLHKEGGTVGPPSPRSDRIVAASGLRFLSRHGRPRWLAPTVFLALRLGNRAVRGNFAGVSATLKGAADWWRQPSSAPRYEQVPS